MYPPGGRLVRLPYRLNEESAKYVERTLPALEGERRFVLVVPFQGSTFEPWLRGRLAPRGFQSESLGDFGSVGVFLFSRAPFQSEPDRGTLGVEGGIRPRRRTGVAREAERLPLIANPADDGHGGELFGHRGGVEDGVRGNGNAVLD